MTTVQPEIPVHQTILFYDGICHLCSWAVQYLQKHDKDSVFSFIPLGSLKAKGTEKYHWVDSVILQHNGVFYFYSDVLIESAKILGGRMKWWGLLRLVPKPIRDAGYKLVAKNRFLLFGKRKDCRVESTLQLFPVRFTFIEWQRSNNPRNRKSGKLVTSI
ncbi:MAG: DUF393 domain-containing protein [Bacteroidales bacterium]|jgi:predicted DCC family thiol-disulfide oxidoreductase YuxK|nr:DUF393 domain-containing protein [Bacteroidales bacterium]MDD3010789.1 DUF393 domain-containing protein [Bacteroidales bacterium]MDY0285113.1 DUF393 domain-containing protein [Bacteroidales bacterium]HPE86576.1 DUF393 domain-containing protein [Bacteroidales bacterium]